jgi:hypothetical protein
MPLPGTSLRIMNMDYQVLFQGKLYRPLRVIWGGQIAVCEDEKGDEFFLTRSMIDEIIFDEQVTETR